MSKIDIINSKSNLDCIAEFDELFTELKDESAASIQGGAAFLYDLRGKGGRKLTFNDGTKDLGIYNFDNRASSVKITGNDKWTFYWGTKGTRNKVTLGAGSYNFNYSDNKISSLARAGVNVKTVV